MNTQNNTLSEDLTTIADKYDINPDIFMEAVAMALVEVYAEEAAYKAEMREKTLEQLGNIYNDLSAQVKAMGAIDLTDPPEEYEELQWKMDCVFSLIKEKANAQTN